MTMHSRPRGANSLPLRKARVITVPGRRVDAPTILLEHFVKLLPSILRTPDAAHQRLRHFVVPHLSHIERVERAYHSEDGLPRVRLADLMDAMQHVDVARVRPERVDIGRQRVFETH